MQVWILLLSTMIFIFGILLLTDLKNYRLINVSEFGTGHYWLDDDNGVRYVNVHIKCEYEFRYCRSFKSFTVVKGKRVNTDRGYRVKSAEHYLDIYAKENGETVLWKTISGDEYSQDFYDIEFGENLEIKPRLENVKYEYPAWRIYVHILLFLITLPLMGLSVYNITIIAIELAKQKKESETPVEETPLNL